MDKLEKILVEAGMSYEVRKKGNKASGLDIPITYNGMNFVVGCFKGESLYGFVACPLSRADAGLHLVQQIIGDAAQRISRFPFGRPCLHRNMLVIDAAVHVDGLTKESLEFVFGSIGEVFCVVAESFTRMVDPADREKFEPTWTGQIAEVKTEV